MMMMMMMMMMYNIVRLLIGVPDHSTVQYSTVQYSESCREVQKLIGFIVIIVRWEVVAFLRGLLVSSIIIAKCALLVQ